MCGIFGVTGVENPVQETLEGLARLEYRGYDSAGIATNLNGQIATERAVGKLQALRDALGASQAAHGAGAAIGHTRWATHGAPTQNNAHPHQVGRWVVVHNGIIENHQALKKEMQDAGVKFASETDTEVVPALLEHFSKAGDDARVAVQKTLGRLEGAFALGMYTTDAPETLFAARKGSPLLVAHGAERNYLASDAIAVAPFTSKVTYLQNGDMAQITPQSVTVYNEKGQQATRLQQVVDSNQALAGKDGYRHFMLKEIHEQPHVVSRTLEAYLTDDHSDIALPEMPFDLATLPQLNLVACGTSYYAAMVARYWFEELAGVPVNVDVASEFRYRNPPLPEGGLSVFISQSGETADTLASLELAKEKQRSLGLVNVPTSSIAREAEVMLKTHAGPEIGVASTKAFTTQLVVLALLAIKTAEARGCISPKQRRTYLQALNTLPTRMLEVLSDSSTYEDHADDIAQATSALYLGRGALYPIALEGALKIKEVSYIHAEGAAAGEMKHGLIALVDDNLPIIALAQSGPLLEKALSNVREVAARHARIFLIGDKNVEQAASDISATFIQVPEADPMTTPLLMTLPVQLLAYYVAVRKGTDVDQPRNLAKSVTVE
mgnify:CR=1 FL=1